MMALSTIASAQSSLRVEPDLIDRYKEDGAICLRGVIDLTWIERLRTATDRVIATRAMAMNAQGASGAFLGDIDMYLRDEDFQDFAIEGPNWQIAKSMMCCDTVHLFSDQLFVKEPGTSTPTPWHQDQSYWPVIGDRICSIWVPLDAVSKASSGLEYIRGSHRWNRRFKAQAFGSQDMSWLAAEIDEELPDIDGNPEKYEFLSWDMEPGDCLVHHSLEVHGAGGNTSRTERRRAVSTRWMAPEVLFRDSAPWTSGVTGLCAGAPISPSASLFPPIPLPANRTMPEDLR